MAVLNAETMATEPEIFQKGRKHKKDNFQTKYEPKKLNGSGSSPAASVSEMFFLSKDSDAMSQRRYSISLTRLRHDSGHYVPNIQDLHVFKAYSTPRNIQTANGDMNRQTWREFALSGNFPFIHPACLSKQNIMFFPGSRVHHSLPWFNA